jgi:hypothetical protein
MDGRVNVQSPRTLSALLIDNWRFRASRRWPPDRSHSGDVDFRSKPVRVRASGTLHSPWRRFATALSFFYVAARAFRLRTSRAARRACDLNADGAVGNDPI